MLIGTLKHSLLVPNTFKLHWIGLGGPRTRLLNNFPPRDCLKATCPKNGQGAKMGHNGVQKGACPLTTCLQAPQSIYFWSQTHLRCTAGHNLSKVGPNKGLGAKRGQNGVQNGACQLKTCEQVPQSFHFWSQTNFRCTGMGWEAQDPTCQNFTSQGQFKGNKTQQRPRGAIMGQNGVQKEARPL